MKQIFLILVIFANTYSQDQNIDKPTIEQLRNTDQVKISFRCTRDTYAQAIDTERWLSIATAVDTLIDDCYASTDDSALYEKVFDTVRFVIDKGGNQPELKIQLVVTGQTVNKISHHTISSINYTLITYLNDAQLEQLSHFYQQAYAKSYTIDQLKMMLKHSVYFALLESNSQQIVGFARLITDYVRFAEFLDLIIMPEYQSEELGQLLIHAALNNPISSLLTLQANYKGY